MTEHAKIAQLVEHNLAKVGVAGSSPVFRSQFHYHNLFLQLSFHRWVWWLRFRLCPDGGIGRRATLRG